MGFFDLNCMVTGISLQSVEATAVVLQRSSDGIARPIALPMHGTYDRLGGVDAVAETPATIAFVDHLVAAKESGRLVTGIGSPDVDIVVGRGYSTRHNLEQAFRALGAGNRDVEYGQPPSVLLDGEQITYALIATTVWQALAATARRPSAAEVDDIVERALARSPELGAIYGPRLRELVDELNELCAVDDAIAARGLVWKSPNAPGQKFDSGGRHHDDDTVDKWLQTAREVYRYDPVVLAGLDAYRAELDAAHHEAAPPEPRPPREDGWIGATADGDLLCARAAMIVMLGNRLGLGIHAAEHDSSPESIDLRAVETLAPPQGYEVVSDSSDPEGLTAIATTPLPEGFTVHPPRRGPTSAPSAAQLAATAGRIFRSPDSTIAVLAFDAGPAAPFVVDEDEKPFTMSGPEGAGAIFAPWTKTPEIDGADTVRAAHSVIREQRSSVSFDSYLYVAQVRGRYRIVVGISANPEQSRPHLQPRAGIEDVLQRAVQAVVLSG